METVLAEARWTKGAVDSGEVDGGAMDVCAVYRNKIEGGDAVDWDAIDGVGVINGRQHDRMRCIA